MNQVSVLLIIFNRPDTTQQVFDAIKEARPKRLYIAADAPRFQNEFDRVNCMLARDVTEYIDWDCDVKRLYQSDNLGCSLGPRAAFDWFFSQESEGIILEDDCVPHPDFFRFASNMLEKFRNNKSIISINGSNLGYSTNFNESYIFSRFMNMWGWATWADRAKSIDYSLDSWKHTKQPLWFLYRRLRQHIFDTDINWYRYWKDKFDLTINSNKISWWDWQWIWHQLSHKQLSVVPGHNLVTNIGFNNAATHTTEANNPAAGIKLEALPQPIIHPNKIKPDFKYEEYFVKWVWCYHKRLPTFFYIKKGISSLLKIK